MQGSVQTEATSTNAGSFWAKMLRPFARGFIKFLLFLQRNSSPLLFISRFNSFSVIHISVDIIKI